MVRENESRTKADIDDINILKDWLLKQPHLPKDFDDNFLNAFLCQCKSLEKAKRKIDSFCAYRTKMSHYFEFPIRDTLAPQFKDFIGFTNMFFLPNPTPEGYRVLMIKGNNVDKFNHLQCNVRIMMMLEAGMDIWPDMTGLITVMDVIGSDYSMLPKMNFSIGYNAIRYIEDVIPMKIKYVLVYNTTPVTEYIFSSVLAPFVKNKILKRTVITSEDEKFLSKYFPIEMLPNDCAGGKAPSVKELNDKWLKILEEKRDWFLRYSKFCSDESKRPPDSEKMNSMEGTFKYLNID